MRFFIFYFIFFFTSIGLCLHAHAKPKKTEKFQLPYFQKSNGILHVFELPRAYILPKQQTFFVFRSKNEKKKFKKKKMKVWILKNQMRTEKQMRAAALRHKMFFSLIHTKPSFYLYFYFYLRCKYFYFLLLLKVFTLFYAYDPLSLLTNRAGFVTLCLN